MIVNPENDGLLPSTETVSKSCDIAGLVAVGAGCPKGSTGSWESQLVAEHTGESNRYALYSCRGFD